MVDYELINEINDNDQKAVDELIDEYENEEFATTDYEFVEGCIFDGSRGIYIPYNVVLFAIDYGYIPTEEFKEMQKDAQIKEEEEEDYITHNFEWIYEEMERSESFLNDKYANKEHYFGSHPDWGDWGYYQYVDEDQEME